MPPQTAHRVRAEAQARAQARQESGSSKAIVGQPPSPVPEPSAGYGSGSEIAVRRCDEADRVAGLLKTQGPICLADRGILPKQAVRAAPESTRRVAQHECAERHAGIDRFPGVDKNGFHRSATSRIFEHYEVIGVGIHGQGERQGVQSPLAIHSVDPSRRLLKLGARIGCFLSENQAVVRRVEVGQSEGQAGDDDDPQEQQQFAPVWRQPVCPSLRGG